MAEIIEKVQEVIAEKLSVETSEVTLDKSFNDLGADSLDTVELLYDFQKEFGVHIPDEDAEKILTVGDAVNYIKEHIQ